MPVLIYFTIVSILCSIHIWRNILCYKEFICKWSTNLPYIRILYLQRAFLAWLHILRSIRILCANILYIFLYVYFYGTELKFSQDTKFILSLLSFVTYGKQPSKILSSTYMNMDLHIYILLYINMSFPIMFITILYRIIVMYHC